jgi:hypothetical protein
VIRSSGLGVRFVIGTYIFASVGPFRRLTRLNLKHPPVHPYWGQTGAQNTRFLSLLLALQHSVRQVLALAFFFFFALLPSFEMSTPHVPFWGRGIIVDGRSFCGAHTLRHFGIALSFFAVDLLGLGGHWPQDGLLGIFGHGWENGRRARSHKEYSDHFGVNNSTIVAIAVMSTCML